MVNAYLAYTMTCGGQPLCQGFDKTFIIKSYDLLCHFFNAFFSGSSSGIGASTALLFAKEGASVTITGRKQDRLKATHDSIVAAGVPEDRIHSILGDIREEEVQKQLINDTVAKFGHLDILVNNAGGTLMEAGFEPPDEDFVYNIEFTLHPYYAIAKAGLDQLTRALAIDLIEHGVRVNGVSPGIVETRFVENTGVSEENSKKVYKFYSSHKAAVPRGSNGTPEEIASVIAFLCDRQVSSYIVGQMIVVDGGSSLVIGISSVDWEKIISS
ncbi:unnamed protein product [Nippostrongylus brasiliensis]|uniref:NAD(P)-binding protein n=1 Tax=Nippostrongylus brasiliensis TaxID=27835 RepID=A0A0N4YB11_NIPBR|nr:unnamed protein product [Nippostrongylus brasiliensis]